MSEKIAWLSRSKRRLSSFRRTKSDEAVTSSSTQLEDRARIVRIVSEPQILGSANSPTSTTLEGPRENGELSTIEEAAELPTKAEPAPTPIAVEGYLSYRKGDSSNRIRIWKQIYVSFDMRNGGVLACFKKIPGGDSPKSLLKRGEPNTRLSAQVPEFEPEAATIHLPAHVDWFVKDIKGDAYSFVIEVSPEYNEQIFFLEENTRQEQPWHLMVKNDARVFDDVRLDLPQGLKKDLEPVTATTQPHRIYFKCSKSIEKVLWLHAFEEVGRLSHDLHRNMSLRNVFRNMRQSLAKSRTRSPAGEIFAKQTEALRAHEHEDESEGSIHDDPGIRIREAQTGSGKELTEHMVLPHYAYPNRWMTDRELHAEVVKPSETFHDLRRSDAPQKEIGVLKVEILQCIGLPSLDFASDTDAVAYMVCGSYAFTSDVIMNKLNPIWLPRSRRACIFPIFHAYARLYVGIFDDDGSGEKDDFAGRVVVDIARLRPRSTYDVILPLRLSGHVYSRKPRGCVRLRLSIEYYSERDALLSYLPKKLPELKPDRHDDDVTVVCGDEKAFRNITTTVHGIHMPGRFSFKEWRAAMREASFATKLAMNLSRAHLTSIIKWKNPSTSLLLFVAWMHTVYTSLFSLVPVYLMLFLLLVMVQNYAFYGSDGPVQKGFVPPSFEDMFMILIKGGTEPIIQPLSTKPKRTRQVQLNGVDVRARTHESRENLLLRALAFHKTIPPEELLPGDYDMEFPYSRGLRNPETGLPHYPKFTVKDAIVIAKKKKKTGDCIDDDDDDGDSVHSAVVTKPPGNVTPKRIGWKVVLSRLKSNSDDGSLYEHDEEEHGTSAIEDDVQPRSPPRKKLTLHGAVRELARRVNHTPPRKIIPEQDMDAKVPATKRKKLGDELNELRDNIHKLTFHAFNDRTHRIRNRDAVYFGTHRGRPDHVAHELDRLLNVGHYSSSNPLVARVGLYMEPIISAAHSGLGLLRALYNVLTWRDPILSFWVSLALFASFLILAIFPWRLFFFVTGWLVLGPQNYFLRIMEERGTTPVAIKEFFAKRREARVTAKAAAIVARRNAIVPTNQPIIFCHTSDNTPPKERVCDPREVHEVCVPYSQLMYHRMYDWPPDPRYAKCTPNADLERVAQKLQESRHRRHIQIRRKNSSIDSAHQLGSSTSSLVSLGSDTGSFAEG